MTAEFLNFEFKNIKKTQNVLDYYFVSSKCNKK